MKLKTKANIVGDVAIICFVVAYTVMFFSTLSFRFEYSEFIIFFLMLLYSEMRDKYLKIRIKEIDELVCKNNNEQKEKL